MTHKIICYGDSNTYGACGFVGGRHAADSRWTGILHDSGLYEVINLGENGREIPSDRWEFNELADFLRQEPDFDLLTIMLGTNDLLTMVRSGSAVHARISSTVYPGATSRRTRPSGVTSK